MRLEAIAALLGHRSLRMTMTYARIANTTVADEYAAAQASVDALYDDHTESDELRQLRLEHRRMLGNGYCARPAELDHHVPGKGDPMSVWASAPPDLHQQDADIRDLDPGDFPHITGWLSALPKIGSDP
jgi:hypothetical protein